MPLGAKAGDVFLEGHYRNAASFGREMSVAVQTPASRAGMEASKHFGRKFAAGIAIGGAIIGAGLVKATKAAARGIKATTAKASDLNETINKTNVIFGKSAAEIQKWSRGSARNMGLSRQEALASASAFGDIFLQLKIGRPAAVNMSKGMVQLAADFASFHNADITQVLEAQQSAFRGEYDALQRFVPGITAARVEQEALNATHKKSAKDLTAADKAQATYNIMLRDGARASGDFKRTSDQLANTRRIEKAQWEDLQAAIGKRFLPAQLAVHRALSQKILPALGQLVKTYGPGVERTATRWANAFADNIPTARQLSLGLAALSAAYREGDVTSDGFVGSMERVGVAARKVNLFFDQLRPSLAEAWRNFRATGVQASDLAPTLHLTGAAFKFIADHADFLARNIGLVVGALVAYKGIQAAAQAADVARVALLPAQVAGNFALAKSNKTLAASLGERTAATVTVTAAESRAIGTTAAWGTATQAAAGRTAMFASGLTVLGGALVVGDLLDRLTDRLGRYKRAAEVAMLGTGLLSVTVGGMKDAWRAMTGAQDAAAASTRVAMSAAERHTAAVRAEKQAINLLEGALRGEESAEIEVRQAKLNVATAQQRLTELVKGGRKGSLDYKQAQLDLKRAQLDLKARTDEYRSAQQRATVATGGAMQAAQRAQGPYRQFGREASTAGDKAFQMGRRARDGLALINSRRVTVTAKFGIDTGSTGLSVHQIVGATGGYVTPHAIVPRNLHRGGFLDGPGTETSDSIPARLSKGEYVVNAKAVRRVGRRNLDYLNAKGYATGGPVLEHDFASGRELGRAGAGFNRVLGQAVQRLAARFKKNMDKLWGGGIGGLSGPGGWRWQMAVLRRVFPGLALISGYRPGAITATGNRSYHSFGRAVDVPPRMDVFNWIRGTYGAKTKELIFSPAGGRQIHNGRPHMYTGVTRADHWDHVHWAYDKGGWLMPGTTIAQNNTGRPERVLPPGTPQTVINVNVQVSGVVGNTREVTERLAPELYTQLKRHAQRQGRTQLATLF